MGAWRHGDCDSYPVLDSIPSWTLDRRYPLRYRTDRYQNCVVNATPGARGFGALRIEAVSMPKYRTVWISKGPKRNLHCRRPPH